MTFVGACPTERGMESRVFSSNRSLNPFVSDTEGPPQFEVEETATQNSSGFWKKNENYYSFEYALMNPMSEFGENPAFFLLLGMF